MLSPPPAASRAYVSAPNEFDEPRPTPALAEGDLDVNIDVGRDRIRELDWSVEEYRREV